MQGRRKISAMDMNNSGKSVNQVVSLVRMCGKPFVLRRVDGKPKAFTLSLPDLGPVPAGGGKVLWMWEPEDAAA